MGEMRSQGTTQGIPLHESITRPFGFKNSEICWRAPGCTRGIPCGSFPVRNAVFSTGGGGVPLLSAMSKGPVSQTNAADPKNGYDAIGGMPK